MNNNSDFQRKNNLPLNFE